MKNISKYSKKVCIALEFASQKHKGQYRVGGLPYVTHPIAVAEMLEKRGFGEDYIISALFHDLLEDTDATEEEISALGGERVLDSVKLLTKREGYNMAEYIGKIKKDPIAFAVKGADRLHNLLCAVECNDGFKRKYISESTEWFMDFNEDIPAAIDRLKESLSEK